MSRRGPLIIIGITAIVLLGTPYAIGMINENAMNREIDRMSEQGMLSTRIESFDRGWFSTRATLVISINPDILSGVAGGGNDPLIAMLFGGFTLPIVVEIDHGPILLGGGPPFGTASVRAFVAPESQISLLARQILGMPYVLELRGHGTFFSGFAYEGDIPPVDFTATDMSVNSTGVVFSGSMDGGDKTFSAELANLALQSPFASAIVESLTVNNSTSQGSPDEIPLGTSELAIARVAVSNPLQGTAGAFSVESARVSAGITAADAGEHINMQLAYGLGHANILNEFDISDMAMAVNLGHIDRQATNLLYRLSQTVLQEADPETIMAELAPAMERILSGSPTLSIDPFAFSMTEGSVSGTLAVAVDATALPTGQLADLQNIGSAMTALNADLNLRASKPLAQRIAALIMANQAGELPGPDGEPLPPDQVEAMMSAQSVQVMGLLAAQGLVVDDGDAYTTSVTLTNGAATVNGQPLPPFGL